MIGRQVAHYRIEAQIGEGGMGTVYRALDLTLDRPVALKRLSPQLARDASLKERFQSEAKAQANLNHPNIATVYGYVQDGDSAFIAMEYIQGETLEQRIRLAPIPPDEAIQLLRQALSGLGHAHRMGIIHRDIKPANLMVNRQGTVKLLDFGLAKVLGAQRITQSGIRVGSVFYMSPEQIRNETLGPRSDIYSLGVTLYEMLSGKVPFAGDSDFQVMLDHVKLPPPALTCGGRRTPAGLEAAVWKALEKDPARRFRNVEEFAEALAQLESPSSAAPVQPPEIALEPARRNSLAMFWMLGAATIAALALVLFLFHSRPTPNIPLRLPGKVAPVATTPSLHLPLPDDRKAAPALPNTPPTATLKRPETLAAPARAAAPPDVANQRPPVITTEPPVASVQAAAVPAQPRLPDRRFDGIWNTNLSCESVGATLGYSFQFPSVVKDGKLHGEKGTKDAPGWLQLDGTILPDGSATIYAKGLVGASRVAVGQLPAGTPYAYNVAANFSADSGSGKRIGGRACFVTFDAKQ